MQTRTCPRFQKHKKPKATDKSIGCFWFFARQLSGVKAYVIGASIYCIEVPLVVDMVPLESIMAPPVPICAPLVFM